MEDPVQDGVERREEKDTVAQISIEIHKGRDIYVYTKFMQIHGRGRTLQYGGHTSIPMHA